MKYFIILSLAASCSKMNIKRGYKIKGNEHKKEMSREDVSKCIWKLSSEYYRQMEAKKKICEKPEKLLNRLKRIDRALLEEEATLLNGDKEYIPLFEAVKRKSAQAIYILYKISCELGYDFNKKWNIGKNKYTFKEYYLQFWKKNSEIEIINQELLEIAVEKNDVDFLKFFTSSNFIIKKSCLDNQLVKLIKNGFDGLLKVLVKANVNLDVKTSNETSLAMLAAANGHEGCLEVLIGGGVDLDQVNEEGNNALMYSAANGHEGCLRLLIGEGVDLNRKNNDGWIIGMKSV